MNKARTSSPASPVSLLPKGLALLSSLLFAVPLVALDRGIAEITGTLHVIVDDNFESDTSSLFYSVKDDADGGWIDLDLPQDRPVSDLHTGIRVRLRGYFQFERFTAETVDVIEPVTDGAATGTSLVGIRRVVVILVNMADGTLGANCSASQVAVDLFTNADSMANFYPEASFGQLTFPADTDGNGQPDIFGPFPIPDSSTDGTGSSMPRRSWVDHAEAAAIAAGVDFSLYQHRMFIFPRFEDVCEGGWGELGCSDGTCYVAACAGSSIFPECKDTIFLAHEIGHNLGMHHASADADDNGTPDPGDEYGDGSSVMGDGSCGQRRHRPFHPTGPHKNLLGWFDAFPGSFIEAGASPMNHTLLAIEPTPASGTRLIRTLEGYYLSTRQTTGFDALLDVPCALDTFNPFSGRTSIHRLSANGHSLLVAMLDDGETFTRGNTEVLQLSHTSTSVTLRIQPPGLLFADGFEDGTLDLWSLTAPP